MTEREKLVAERNRNDAEWERIGAEGVRILDIERKRIYVERGRNNAEHDRINAALTEYDRTHPPETTT